MNPQTPIGARLRCKLLGHSYVVLESQNWGRYHFGDGSSPHFLGTQVSKLWCQRCNHRIDDVQQMLVQKGSYED